MSIAMPAAEDSRVRIEPPTLTRRGRVRAEGLSDTDRNFALAIHLTALAGVFIHVLLFAPLVLWLIRKNQSAFDDDHGRELINMQLTGLVLFPICVITVIGIPLAIMWGVVMFINMIRGAVAAGSGEYFRYPMTIRFLS